MAELLAVPPVSTLRGTLRVPPSKSATNRALLLAALTDSPVEIVRPLESQDTAALGRCLVAMGASIGAGKDGLRVSGPLRGDPRSLLALDAGDSGTAARFLTAVCAAVPGRFLLTGSRRLCERPVGALVEALRAAGARVEYTTHQGVLPLAIEGGTLRSGTIEVDASASSQFLSALLLAAVAVEGGMAVRASGPLVSAAYVRTTLDTLREFGHEAEEGPWMRVRRGQRMAARFEVPGDYSSAVALMAAAGAAGGELTLIGLRWPSRDADAAALPVLQRMGVRLATAEERIEVGSAGSLSPVSVVARDFPDSVPALAALAALAAGESRFSGIAHLRLKESDRLAALVEILGAAGVRAVAEEDALAVTGPPRTSPRVPARLPTFGDHRMAMAAAILSLRLPGLLIEDPACVAKSYPGFFRDLESVSIR